MSFRNLLPGLVLLGSLQTFAADGVIHFQGRVLESTCQAQTDQSKAVTLTNCSHTVQSSTVVTIQTVTPDAHMVVWRDTETGKRDSPVTRWQVTEVVYR